MAKRRKTTTPRRAAPRRAAREHHKPLPPPVESFRARMRRQKTPLEKFADFMTRFFGTVPFFIVNMLFFAVWILWHLGYIPGLVVFDPYPFGLLTMMVSLEAIALSIIVLISQNRAARIAEAREEADFQIDLEAEKQIAAIMRSLDRIMHHLEIGHHEERSAMRAMDIDSLERRVMTEIDTD